MLILIVDCHEILESGKNNVALVMNLINLICMKLLINIEKKNYGMENAIKCEESSICEFFNEKIYGLL